MSDNRFHQAIIVHLQQHEELIVPLARRGHRVGLSMWQLIEFALEILLGPSSNMPRQFSAQ
jgi:hypothetical protein